MNKKDFRKNLCWALGYDAGEKFSDFFESKNAGKKGTPAKRERFFDFVKSKKSEYCYVSEDFQKERRKKWNTKKGLGISKKVDLYFDEHGSGSGDYQNTYVEDYVSPWEGSDKAPYFDMGGEGLAVISVSRTRVYAGSTWRPSTNHTTYLIGKNEAGTYFAHPVHKDCNTVLEAVNWIWGYKKIIARQGDIAVAPTEKKKRKIKLPDGHRLFPKMGVIYHSTHPVLNLKKYPGCEIITGKRAVAQLGSATRD
jgi:hypothetical protein